MRIICAILFLLVSRGYAGQVNLAPGESVLIQANVSTTVTCAMGPSGSLQSATSKTCGRVDYDGNCVFFNETTLTGRYCGEAQVCGRVDYDGHCVFFNVIADCGDNGCTKSKTCGRQDYDGKCIYFNEGIRCH